MAMKVVIITNGPVPYRIPALNELAAKPGISLHVVFCCAREPNRDWSLPKIQFPCTYLREKIIRFKDRYIHNNLDVFPVLRRLKPDIVITGGFNPTHLYGFAYTWLKRIPHIAMTDGTYDSEKTLSILHRWLRHVVYARTKAFLSSSIGGQKLFSSYGIADSRCFRACLCVENMKFSDAETNQHGKFDFLFCGRMEAVKNPHFALDVAIAAAARLKRKTSILFVGSGSQEPQLRKRAAAHRDALEVEFHGSALQDELPALYRSARLFLFPTTWDPWGVVSNEACAAGLPVLISPHAGAADELVVDGENGHVCELDVALWADRAVTLLVRPDVYSAYSRRSQARVSSFTFKHASDGMFEACRYARAYATDTGF
jgi:glycosyltransferase involved in cell wall biosynthesis